MSFFVYGRDIETGNRVKLCLDDVGAEAVARQRAEAKGVRVLSVIEHRPSLDEHSAYSNFVHKLETITPRPYATYALLCANVLVFVLMVGSGVEALSPGIPELEQWGAQYGPLTTDGQYWRLFTAMFVHIGLIHFMCNMTVLFYFGSLAERLIGNAAFLLLYLVAGVSGNLLSLYWNPIALNAGASGALFGVFGGLLGVLLRQRATVPQRVAEALIRSVLIAVSVGLLNSLRPGIGFASHLGGVLSGFICGLMLGDPWSHSLSARAIRWVAVAIFGTTILAGGLVCIDRAHPNLARTLVQQSLDRFEKLNQSIDEDYEFFFGKAPPKIEELEKYVLPKWKEMRHEIDGLVPVPVDFQDRIAKAKDYMQLRQRSWEGLLDALHELDYSKREKAWELKYQADEAMGVYLTTYRKSPRSR